MQATDERIVFDNEFGRITDRRLIFSGESRGRARASRRDIPLRAIASVEYIAVSHPVAGILFGMAGAAALIRAGIVGSLPNAAFAVAAFIIAVGLIRGPRAIALSFWDGQQKRLPVPRFRPERAEAFAAALRAQVFADDGQSHPSGLPPR